MNGITNNISNNTDLTKILQAGLSAQSDLVLKNIQVAVYQEALASQQAMALKVLNMALGGIGNNINVVV